MGYKYCNIFEQEEKRKECSKCDTRCCNNCSFMCNKCDFWFCKLCEHPQSNSANDHTIYKRERKGYDGDARENLNRLCKKCCRKKKKEKFDSIFE